MIGTLSIQSAKQVLQSNIVGRIGCHDGTRTYVVPVQYVFDGKCVYAHSVEGMKIHIMRKHPDVCFEVDDIKNLNNWKSVIAWGRYDELTSEHQRYEVIKSLVYHGPGKKNWEEKPKPVIQSSTDAIVKIIKTTICGTDLHILAGDVPEVTDGRILGHEGVGIIEETGSSVSNFKKGDHVI